MVKRKKYRCRRKKRKNPHFKYIAYVHTYTITKTYDTQTNYTAACDGVFIFLGCFCMFFKAFYTKNFVNYTQLVVQNLDRKREGVV